MCVKAIDACSSVLKLLLLLAGLNEEVLGWRWSNLVLITREDHDFEDLAMNSSNETTTTAPPSSEPILTANAIANIVLSGLAIIFLSSVLCYLMATFNQVEHRTRVRTSLERNKQIDRQIAATRARQQQQKLKQQELDQDALKVEMVGGAEDSSRTASIEPVDGSREDGVVIEGGQDPTTTKNREKDITVVSSEVVVDLEDKVSGSPTLDDDSKPLINVSDSAYGKEENPPNQQPLLLVQPAQAELV